MLRYRTRLEKLVSTCTLKLNWGILLTVLFASFLTHLQKSCRSASFWCHSIQADHISEISNFYTVFYPRDVYQHGSLMNLGLYLNEDSYGITCTVQYVQSRLELGNFNFICTIFLVAQKMCVNKTKLQVILVPR
jgi:hypothetical protein